MFVGQIGNHDSKNKRIHSKLHLPLAESIGFDAANAMMINISSNSIKNVNFILYFDYMRCPKSINCRRKAEKKTHTKIEVFSNGYFFFSCCCCCCSMQIGIKHINNRRRRKKRNVAVFFELKYVVYNEWMCWWIWIEIVFFFSPRQLFNHTYGLEND